MLKALRVLRSKHLPDPIALPQFLRIGLAEKLVKRPADSSSTSSKIALRLLLLSNLSNFSDSTIQITKPFNLKHKTKFRVSKVWLLWVDNPRGSTVRLTE